MIFRILEYLGGWVGVVAELVNSDVVQPLPRLVGVAGVDVDCNNFEGWAAHLRL